jgi:hypothetical protein
MVIKKIQKGVVGVLDDGTVLACDEETEKRLRDKGVKVIRVGKVIAS